jgi:hypothetical protein
MLVKTKRTGAWLDFGEEEACAGELGDENRGERGGSHANKNDFEIHEETNRCTSGLLRWLADNVASGLAFRQVYWIALIVTLVVAIVTLIGYNCNFSE